MTDDFVGFTIGSTAGLLVTAGALVEAAPWVSAAIAAIAMLPASALVAGLRREAVEGDTDG